MAKFEADLQGKAAIATVSGRYYAMDRDKRWDRVDLAYRALMSADGLPAADAQTAIDISYAAGKTDEFMLPTIMPAYPGHDRRRRHPDGQFPRRPRPRAARRAARSRASTVSSAPRRRSFAAALGLVEYSTSLSKFMGVLFPPTPLTHILGEVLASRRQDAVAHRRDREIRPCDVLLQRRRGKAIPRRRAHLGAVAQGRDLRSAARDVGRRSDRQAGRGDSGRASSTSCW